MIDTPGYKHDTDNNKWLGDLLKFIKNKKESHSFVTFRVAAMPKTEPTSPATASAGATTLSSATTTASTTTTTTTTEATTKTILKQ